jgi:hypothetical protein
MVRAKEGKIATKASQVLSKADEEKTAEALAAEKKALMKLVSLQTLRTRSS